MMAIGCHHDGCAWPGCQRACAPSCWRACAPTWCVACNVWCAGWGEAGWGEVRCVWESSFLAQPGEAETCVERSFLKSLSPRNGGRRDHFAQILAGNVCELALQAPPRSHYGLRPPLVAWVGVAVPRVHRDEQMLPDGLGETATAGPHFDATRACWHVLRREEGELRTTMPRSCLSAITSEQTSFMSTSCTLGTAPRWLGSGACRRGHPNTTLHPGPGTGTGCNGSDSGASV